jgi:cell division protein FtsW
MAVGLIIVFAISPALSATNNVSDNYYVSKQAIAIIMGFAAFLLTANIKPQVWRKLEKPLLFSSFGASIAVRFFGEQVNGAYRWVQIGGFSFQAAELIKFSLVIWLAGFLADRIKRGTLADWNDTLKPLGVAVAIIGFVVAVIQSDLGSASVMIAIIISMTYVAGMPMKKVVMAGMIVLLGVILAISTSSYRRSRLNTFLNPASDCQNAGYQSCQALIAVGSGGMFGQGIGSGVQAYGYLPEAANDSIFAIYGEKFGFIGSVLLIGLYILLFSRLIKIIERTPNEYMRLLTVGVLAWLSTQALINIGAMTGMLPLKGITLPYVSYGGTSIIFVAASIGVVFSVSRYTSYRISREEEGGVNNDHITGRRGERRPRIATVSRRA